MSRVTLVQAAPRLPATGAAVQLRLAGGGSRAFDHLGYTDWLDGIVGELFFTSLLGFDKSGWTSAAVPQTAAIGVATHSAARAAALAALVWPQAAIAVHVGDDANANPAWTTRLAGRVAGAASKDGVLSLTVADLTAALDQPVCPATYAGTGGLEGGSALTGQVKRRSWGRVFNVEAGLADSANNIYEFGDPAHPLQEFLTVKDKGRAGPLTYVAWAGSPEATLAALVAATPPDGGAAVASSIARVKWCTQPVGPLTADILGETGTGYVETAPAIAAAIALAIGGVPTEALATAAALRPDPAGWHVGNGTDTAAAVLLKLLLGVSMAWTISGTGSLLMLPIGYDNPVELVDFDSIERTETYPPVRAVKLGFALNNRVHTDAEISAAITAGDITGLGPLALAPFAQLGSTIVDSHGAVIGDSTVITSLGTAAALYGQSPWATYGGLDPSTVTGQVRYLQGDGYLASPYVYKPGVGFLDTYFPATTGADKTGNATAAAFYGQGSLATLSNLVLGGPYLAGFGGLAALGSIALGSGNINDGVGGPVTRELYRTDLGTSAAFSGQGPWATLARATAAIANLQDDGYMQAAYIFKPGIAYLSNVWPMEADANKTEGRTAAAITGQGAWATSGITISSVTRPSTNLMPYPRPLFALTPQQIGWQLGGSTVGVGFGNNDYSGFGGPSYYLTRGSGGAEATTYTYFDVPIAPDGQTYTASVFMRATSGVANESYFQVINAARDTNLAAQGFAPITSADGSGMARHKATVTNVQGGDGQYGTWLRIVIASHWQAATGYQDLYWHSIKFEPGFEATAYSDSSRQAVGSRSLFYDGGVMGELLRPAEYGANVTEGRTSAAIASQGSLATRSSIASDADLSGVLASRLSPFSGDVSYLSAGRVAWAAGYTVEQYKPQEPGANVTESRTAAAFSGQSSWATYSGLVPSTVYGQISRLQSDGYIEAGAVYRSGVGFLSSYFPATTGADRTSSATSAAVAGQGALATRDSADMTDGSITNRYAEYLVYGATGQTVAAMRPAQANADVTGSNTASAIANQGALATAPRIAGSNVATYFAFSSFQLGYSITRSDGATTVTESMVVTSYGIASAIAGQGRGATANNLADLDPTAAAQLNAASTAVAKSGAASLNTSGGTQTAAYALCNVAGISANSFIEISGSVQISAVSPATSWTGGVGIYEAGSLIATVPLSGEAGTEQDYGTRYQTSQSGTVAFTVKAQRTGGAGNAAIDVSTFIRATPSG